MATMQAVNAGSGFCRDCGGRITSRGGLAWCENTTTVGSQQEPKDRCQNLSKLTRRYCEHCGQAVQGLRYSCGHEPTHP